MDAIPFRESLDQSFTVLPDPFLQPRSNANVQGAIFAARKKVDGRFFHWIPGPASAGARPRAGMTLRLGESARELLSKAFVVFRSPCMLLFPQFLEAFEKFLFGHCTFTGTACSGCIHHPQPARNRSARSSSTGITCRMLSPNSGKPSMRGIGSRIFSLKPTR